jgi:uncharacterized membrane protein YfcA
MIHDLFQYLYSLENVGGVSGSIAVLITVTLCVGYIRNPAAEVNKVGDALIFALTTIIGFYFGTATGMKEPPSSQSSPAAIVSSTAPK